MKKLSIENAAKKWVELKTQVKEVERALDEIKPILEAALAKAPDETLEFHGWRFNRVKFTRESFALFQAKENVDGRILAPYITESEVTQIRTSWQGGEKKAA